MLSLAPVQPIIPVYSATWPIAVYGARAAQNLTPILNSQGYAVTANSVTLPPGTYYGSLLLPSVGGSAVSYFVRNVTASSDIFSLARPAVVTTPPSADRTFFREFAFTLAASAEIRVEIVGPGNSASSPGILNIWR